METRLGGSRVKEITDCLPFNRALHTNTIRHAGGLWLFWNSNKVEVKALAKTEQEIHVEVKASLAFKECLDRCSMVNLGFSGPRYTWTNKRDINNLKLERIDRVFMNPEWCALYPNAKVTHLPRCLSDHCPILLKASLVRAVHLTRPFRFQEFWLSDISFPNVVSKAWGRSRSLAEAIEGFSKESTMWNRCHFGNILHKKKRVMEKYDEDYKAP
ncbi:hypothetical protein CFP56_002606 [Quercus suber]|uniref:Uncharacterized protein n=1 Tax=Quercus suber TaxID=58331 RepID=A0AAW0IJQ5_QUESU